MYSLPVCTVYIQDVHVDVHRYNYVTLITAILLQWARNARDVDSVLGVHRKTVVPVNVA